MKINKECVFLKNKVNNCSMEILELIYMDGCDGNTL